MQDEDDDLFQSAIQDPVADIPDPVSRVQPEISKPNSQNGFGRLGFVYLGFIFLFFKIGILSDLLFFTFA